MEIYLPFKFQPAHDVDLENITPERLRSCLNGRGYSVIVIQDPPLAGYRLPVEDDSEFIFDAYLDLKRRLAGDGKLLGEHHACLDDGRLRIDCTWQREKAVVEISIFKESLGNRYYNETVQSALEQYLGVWAGLVKAMIRYGG
jgi:hypothetical protein